MGVGVGNYILIENKLNSLPFFIVMYQISPYTIMSMLLKTQNK